MIIDSPLEVRLYEKETSELPSLLQTFFSKVRRVSQPEDIQDIQDIYSRAKQENLAVIPRGAATAAMGGLVPLRKSLMLDTARLNRILDLDEKRKTVLVESGVRWWELKRVLGAHSLDVYTYPTSLFSTVGGWLSTGGLGINGFRYGHLSNLVDSLSIESPAQSHTFSRGDREFSDLFGTEGQLGIISRIKLRVRKRTPVYPFLVYFKDPVQATDFLDTLANSSCLLPSHLVYFDKHHLLKKNALLDGKIGFPAADAVLAVFEDGFDEDSWLAFIEKQSGLPAEDHLAHYLWNERYFPFSLRKHHASILGCESLLPLGHLPQYVSAMDHLAQDWGIPLSTEATLAGRHDAVVFTIFPSDPNKQTSYLHLSLTTALNHVAQKAGARPYALGLWNLALRPHKFRTQELNRFKGLKRQLDPENLLNPGKFISADRRTTSLLGVAGLFGRPLAAKPLKTLLGRLIPSANGTDGALPESEACAGCGACTVVCPAYLVERNEIVTAKGKLFLLKQMKKGAALPRSLAEKAFLCSHCHLCESVCQTRLTLVPVWENLESQIQERHGYPRDKVERFIREIEALPEYSELLDTLNLVPDSRKDRAHV